jgi:DNA-binding CsgD family transcriptional regulator
VTSADTLTGRDEELATLRRALSGTGDYAGVVIAGPAGVGKTRLARELLGEAAAAGNRTSWVAGTASARPIPLGAFAVALGPSGGTPSPGHGDAAPSVRRVINALVGQQNPRRVLIGVDDAHLLDGFSAHVVHHVAQTREARLIVTVRTGGGEPDAVKALWKDGLLARFDLEPLSQESSRLVIEQMLDGPLDARSAKRFWRMTGGNALFIQQLVKDQVSAGRIHQVAGVWMWEGDVAVSQSMNDLVGNRLHQLPTEQALVLDALSQCEPLDLDVLLELVSRDALEAAEQANLVRVERIGGRLRVSLAHPIFGELRRAAAGEMFSSKLRGRLSASLGRHPEGDDIDPQRTVVRAQLALDSDLPPDPALFLDAAKHALRMNEIDLARRFVDAAARHDPAAAARLRALCIFLTQGGDEADAFMRSVVPADEAERRSWQWLRAENTLWVLGKPKEASAILAELADGHESEADRAERLALEACVDAVQARCEIAEEKAWAAIKSGTLSDVAALMAAFALIMASGALGHVDAPVTAVFNEAIERATNSHETSAMRFWFGGVYLRACRVNGRLDECERTAALLTALHEDVPGRVSANLIFLRGQTALMRGDLRGAVRVLHEALATAQHHGVATLRPACYFALVEAHAKLGEADAAAQMLEAARSVVKPDYLFTHTALAIAVGWAQAAAGALNDAVNTVCAEAAVARDRRQPTHELVCLQAAVQWGADERLAEVAARARELATELRLPLAETVALHAESLRDGDGDGLLAAMKRYREIGDRCTAADAAAQAAVVFTGAQLSSRGTSAAHIADQLAKECGGLCTPATRSPISPTPLTGRQREIAELVAVGLSNKQIADRLVTSVRTVEGHILKACQRVGATSRTELARIMRGGTATR